MSTKFSGLTIKGINVKKLKVGAPFSLVFSSFGAFSSEIKLESGSYVRKFFREIQPHGSHTSKKAETRAGAILVACSMLTESYLKTMKPR